MEGIKRNISYGPVRNVLSPSLPPHTKAKTDFWKKHVFLFFFSYAYQKMENGLKHMFFMKEKNFGSKGKIFFEKVFTVYIFSKNNFRTFSIFFSFLLGAIVI